MINILSLAYLILLYFVVAKLSKRVYEYIRQIYYLWSVPGPKSLPILGVAIDLLYSDSKDIFDKTGLQYTKYEGGICKYWIVFRPFVSLTTAKTVEPILSSNIHIEKGQEYNSLHAWLGRGLLTSEGSLWHSRRKLLTPTFHFQILDSYIEVFNAHSQKLVEKLKSSENEPVNIIKFMTSCTLDAIMETAMGVGINAQDGGGVEYCNALLHQGTLMNHMFAKPWLKSKLVRKLLNIESQNQESLKILHHMSLEAIRNRKEYLINNPSTLENIQEGKKKRLSFMDLLLEKSIKENSITETEIREEVDTFMFEGHDTTTSALSFCISSLGFYPEYQQRIRDELEEIFGTSDRAPTMEDLKKMIFLECCFKEAMRLYPTVPIIARLLNEDTVINGHTIPRGSNIVINIIRVHRDPEVFSNPNQYMPERFLQENVNRSPYAFIPFSAGPRNCIGQKFALLEAKTILSYIFRNFSVESCGDKIEDIGIMGELVLRPTTGSLPVKFKQLLDF